MGRQNESVNLVRQGVGPPGECVWEWEREGRAGRGLFSAIPRRSRRPERQHVRVGSRLHRNRHATKGH